jgi:hypothetical protein
MLVLGAFQILKLAGEVLVSCQVFPETDEGSDK